MIDKRTHMADYKRFPLDVPPIAGSVVDPLSLGYVYVIGFEEPGIVKIGSAVSIPTRLAQLQCGNPFELKLMAAVSIYEGDPVQVECAAHRLAADYCIRGEWFGLETDDALRFVIKAARNLKAKFGAAIEAHEASEASFAAVDHAAAEEERRRVLRLKLGMD